jgi:lipoate synthase
MAKRKYDPDRLTKAAADWDIHHALVAAVRRLVKLAGGAQEAKDVIDAIAAADALEEEKDEAP